MTDEPTARLSAVISPAAFVALLNEVRVSAGLSYRDISRRARQAGQALPSSTVWNILAKPLLPRAETLTVYLAACGLGPAEIEDWQATRTRLTMPPKPDLPPVIPAVTPAPVRGLAAQPRQLPPDVYGFVGRQAELATLDGLLDGARPPAMVVSGQPGIGKSALAKHWAHRVAGRFPDGQIYVDLRGHAVGPPLDPLAALHRMLRALGVAIEQLPLELDDAAAMFRSEVAGRRVLVLLEDAASPAQVRWLLAGEPQCLTLVTARDRLSGLVASDGVRSLSLGVLSPDEAVSLLSEVTGGQAIAADPAAAWELARIGGYLPIALRIMAANLWRDEPGDLAGYVAKLREGPVLRQLSVPGDEQSAVLTAFDLSYQDLSPAQRRIFRELGLLPVRDFTATLAAHALAVPVREAAETLPRLADLHLLQPAGPGRYSFHDLLRDYARQLAERELEAAHAETGQVADRAYDWYLGNARTAADLLYPQLVRLPSSSDSKGFFTDRQEALDWLAAEEPNLETAILAAPGLGLPRYSWELADLLRGRLAGRSDLNWLSIGQCALSAAKSAGDVQAVAWAHLLLGLAIAQNGDHAGAVGQLDLALRLSQRAGWEDGAGSALDKLGITYSRLGELDRAVDYMERSLELAVRSGRSEIEAIKRNNLATIYIAMGRLDGAREQLVKAVRLHRIAGTLRGEAAAMSNLGLVDYHQGQLDSALEYQAAAWWLHHQIGNADGGATALKTAADIHLRAGEHGPARILAQSSLRLARSARRPLIESIALNTLAAVRDELGQHQQAVRLFHRALRLSEQLGLRRAQIEALTGLAISHQRAGDNVLADRYQIEALALARESGFRLLERRARRLCDPPASPPE
jgi:tetratricopeptide (TPR) repeat protein